MCYQRCMYENWNGDCKMFSYPKGFVCPPDRAYCDSCEEMFHEERIDDDGYCEDCALERKIDEAEDKADQEMYGDYYNGA